MQTNIFLAHPTTRKKKNARFYKTITTEEQGKTESKLNTHTHKKIKNASIMLTRVGENK